MQRKRFWIAVIVVAVAYFGFCPAPKNAERFGSWIELQEFLNFLIRDRPTEFSKRNYFLPTRVWGTLNLVKYDDQTRF